jgi:F-type H+-transporting ATPase subunit b
MKIDPFTLIAQIINFLILIALLRFFLYKRITNAMDEREQRIVDRINQAKQKKLEAEREAESYRIKNKELEEKQNEIITRAKEKANKLSKELTQKARKEVEERKRKWNETIQSQKKAFLSQLKQRAGQQIYSVAKRVIQDLADEELETQIIRTFIGRLRTLKAKEKNAIKNFSQKSREVILIESGFSIGKQLQNKIKKTMEEQIEEGIDLTFETTDKLVCGVEIKVPGMKLSWSIDSYLQRLEENLVDAFNKR